MALSGSFYTNVEDHWRLQAEWSGTQNIGANTTSITLNLYWMGLSKYGTTNTTATKDGAITINGNTKTFSGAGLAKLTGSQKKLISSHVVVVPHNADGTKSVNLSAYFDVELTLSGQWFGRVNVSQTVTLNTIPRASSLSSSANWTAGNSLPISVSRASTSFTHDITIKVNGRVIKYLYDIATSTTVNFTDTENQWIFEELAKDTINFNQSSSIEVKTKSGATVIGTKTATGTVSSPNATYTTTQSDFDIGDSFGVGINRSNSNFTHLVKLRLGSTLIKQYENVGATLNIDTSDVTGLIYSLTPNSNEIGLLIETFTYFNGVLVRKATTESIVAKVINSNPIFNDTFTYKDSNVETVGITNNDQYIIQNNSTIIVTIPVGALATPQNQATMKEYVAILGGSQAIANHNGAEVVFNFGTINAQTDQTLSIKAIDSRGNSTTKTKTVKIIPYAFPTVNATAKRLNGFENNTTITMNGIISPIMVDGVNKNAVQLIQYRYRDTTVGTVPTWDTWTPFTYSINLNEYTANEVVLDLDNTASFYVEFMVEDVLNNETELITVSVGEPLLFIDSKLKSVGVGKFPEFPNCLEVKENIYINGQSITDLFSITPYIDTSTGAIELTPTIGESVNVNSDLVIKGTSELHFDRGRTNTSRIYWNASSSADYGMVLQVDNETSLVVNKPSGIISTISYNNFAIGAGRELQFLNGSAIKFDTYGNILPRDSADLSATATWSVRAVDNAIRLLIPISTNGSQNIEINPPSNGHVTIGGGIGNIIKTKSEANLSTYGGWINYSDYYDNIRYVKTASGLVVLKGLIEGGSGHIATLPVGCRPYNRRIFICYCDTGYARVDVFPDGKIEQMTGTGGFLSLSPIVFYAEG